MNYKKYLFIILAVLLGTVPSFAYQLAKADSVIVNTTDSASAAATSQVSPLTTDSVADKKTEPEKVEKKKEKKAEKKDKKNKKSADKKSSKNKANKKSAAKTPKKNKKTETVEYKASRQAAIVAMDSIIKTMSSSKDVTPDHLMAFCDVICKKYNWDPIIMDSIALGFFRFYNNEIFGEQRYNDIYKMHPDYIEAYFSLARLFNQLAWYEESTADGESSWHVKMEFFDKAKARIDSAKIANPDNPEPYLLWYRLLAKYNQKWADAELDSLHMKIPSANAYLQGALYYELIAKGDYRYLLLNARDCYKKAVEFTPELMTAPYWVNYSIMCYETNIPETGIDVAKQGLTKFPNYPGLLRAKLWNEGRFASYINETNFPNMTNKERKAFRDSIYSIASQTADDFITNGDTITKMYTDYKWISTIKYESKNYRDAINYTKSELALDSVPIKEQESAWGVLIDCYREFNDADSARIAFTEYERIKRESGREMEPFDYNRIIQAYIGQYTDTLLSQEKRRAALEAADSLVLLAAESGTEYRGMMYNQHFNYTSALYPEVDGKPSQEVLNAALLLLTKMQELIDNPDESKNVTNNTYFLMIGKYNAMTWYYYSEDYQEALKRAEEIMYDMPEVFELQGLSSGRQKDYQTYKSNAQIILNNTKKKR